MKPNKNEWKINNLNNSIQLSQKTFNPNLLLTDYNLYEDEKGNSKSKTIKLINFNNNFNKSNNFGEKKNKIIVNNNFSKNKGGAESKHIFPVNIIKTPNIINNNKSATKNTNINKSKKNINNEKNLNNSINGKIIPYYTHLKEINEFRNKIEKMKKSDSKGNNINKNHNSRINRNVNLSLNDYLSVGGTEIKKTENLYLNNSVNKSPEIVLIKKNYIKTTKNKLNRRIIGKLNLNNNYSLNDNNSSMNKTNFSNKFTYNIIQSDCKRKQNKKLKNSSSNDSSLINLKYSLNKKLDILKSTLNDEISDINKNYNKMLNSYDKNNIKKNELILDIIQNSFFKFISLLENPKEKEIAFDIIQKLNDFFKKQDNLVKNVIKKNDDLNKKIKKYKEINKNYEKENQLLIERCQTLEKNIEEIKIKYNNSLINNKIYLEESKNLEEINNSSEKCYNDINDFEDNENGSSVNSEELESIRFFDKIIMKKHSFSKANIPELEIKQIKLKNEELENEENLKKNCLIKNLNNKNQNKHKYFGLKKISNKSTKSIGYTKIAEDKKKIDVKKFRKFK